jgi:hypothetical protein
LGQVLLDLAGGFLAVHHGHGHIHNHHIGKKLTGQIYRLSAIGRFANDLDRVLFGEQQRQALPHALVIVSQQHPQSAVVAGWTRGFPHQAPLFTLESGIHTKISQQTL